MSLHATYWPEYDSGPLRFRAVGCEHVITTHGRLELFDDNGTVFVAPGVPVHLLAKALEMRESLDAVIAELEALDAGRAKAVEAIAPVIAAINEGGDAA